VVASAAEGFPEEVAGSAGAVPPAGGNINELPINGTGVMASTTARDFFTTEEKERIEAVVREMEQRTSGEIVPMVVDHSYEYPRSEILGAGLFSLGCSSLFTWGLGEESMWVLISLVLLLYFPFKWLIRYVTPLKRRLISHEEMDEEVAEKAKVAFLEHGLHHTREESGILILLSLFERRVFILADRGISRLVPEETWKALVELVIDGIRTGRACDALCEAIRRCGAILEEKLPPGEKNPDELPNLITE
jgi:putative membrane protein